MRVHLSCLCIYSSKLGLDAADFFPDWKGRNENKKICLYWLTFISRGPTAVMRPLQSGLVDPSYWLWGTYRQEGFGWNCNELTSSVDSISRATASHWTGMGISRAYLHSNVWGFVSPFGQLIRSVCGVCFRENPCCGQINEHSPGSVLVLFGFDDWSKCATLTNIICRRHSELAAFYGYKSSQITNYTWNIPRTFFLKSN